VGRITILDDGQPHNVFKTKTPACPQTCQQVKGSVTCKSGILSGDVTFGQDTCSDPKCSCSITTADGPVYLGEGKSVVLSKVNTNSPSEPLACTKTSNLMTISCTGGNLVPPYDSAVFKYLQSSCKSTDYDCKAGPIAIANGATKTLYKENQPACGVQCSSINVFCNAGNLVFAGERTKPVTSADLTSHPAANCAIQDCDCRVNGYVLPYKGVGKDFYSISTGQCDPKACEKAKITLTCGENRVVSGGNAALHPYDKCDVKACECKLPSGGSIPDGRTGTLFSVEKATCATPDVCEDPANSVKVSCSNGVLTNYDESRFTFMACKPAICSCRANGVQIEFGKSVWFYKNDKPLDTCGGDNAASFECQPGGTLTGDKDISLYKMITCTSPTDSGDLGGTGGGSGNDEGPGSAIRKRFGAGDGGGGGGGGPCFGIACIQFVDSFFQGSGSMQRDAPQFHSMEPCLLPWGGGEIEAYGSLIAFDRKCVVKPDRCSKHRQSRTCHYPNWTGSPAYQYPTCVEKDTCP